LKEIFQMMTQVVGCVVKSVLGNARIDRQDVYERKNFVSDVKRKTRLGEGRQRPKDKEEREERGDRSGIAL
jgi:hypothetical protein